MVKSLERSLRSRPDEPQRRRVSGLQQRSDRWLLAGCLIGGSFVAGPIGLGFILYGLYLLRQAQKRGEPIRPWAVTIVALYCMIDGGLNLVGWAVDLFAHDTVAAKTFFTGFGKIFDGGYYIGYNSSPLGGTPYRVFPAEKGFEIAGTIFLFPMRVVAAWGFFKMKRWGHQFMIITSYMYCFLFVAYMPSLSVQFDLRYGSTITGVTGYWLFNMLYLTPFITLPYLHTVNKELFTD